MRRNNTCYRRAAPRQRSWRLNLRPGFFAGCATEEEEINLLGGPGLVAYRKGTQGKVYVSKRCGDSGCGKRDLNFRCRGVLETRQHTADHREAGESTELSREEQTILFTRPIGPDAWVERGEKVRIHPFHNLQLASSRKNRRAITWGGRISHPIKRRGTGTSFEALCLAKVKGKTGLRGRLNGSGATGNRTPEIMRKSFEDTHKEGGSTLLRGTSTQAYAR